MINICVWITEKQAQIRRACNLDKSEILKSIFEHTAFSPYTYKTVIEQLEQHWGGPQKAYNHIRDTLLCSPKLNLRDPNSVAVMKARIDRYRDHVRVHKITELGTGRTVLNMILSNLFTFYQVQEFRKGCIYHRFKEPNSLQAVSEWLGLELSVLQWAKSSTSKALSQKSDKVSNKGVTYCASATNQSSGIETESSPESAVYVSHSQNSGTALVTGSGEDNVFSTCDDGSDAELSFDEDSDLADMDDMCFAASGFVPPKCSLCTDRHLLHKCPTFLKMEPKQRATKVLTLKRCLNCLSPKHMLGDCKSPYKCSVCEKRHHTVLCFKKVQKKDS